MNKRIIQIAKITEVLTIYLMILFGGFALGMIYQQVLITQEVSEILTYTNLELNINFNATEFTNELNNTFIPAWKTAFNETMHTQLNITNSTR